MTIYKQNLDSQAALSTSKQRLDTLAVLVSAKQHLDVQTVLSSVTTAGSTGAESVVTAADVAGTVGVVDPFDVVTHFLAD